jgi:glycosyltransferase involved in cell wall biosynthesis
MQPMKSDAIGKIAVLYPTDVCAGVAGGIETFLRGFLHFAPPDLSYTLFGASSDVSARPLGEPITLRDSGATFVPIVSMDPAGRRSRIPLSVRYLHSLRQVQARGLLDPFVAFDLHRIEPTLFIGRQRRPCNLILHTDMAVLRNPACEIKWKYAPWAYEYMERVCFPRLERVFCVSRAAVSRYKAAYPGLSDRFLFMPTWVSTHVFRPSAEGVEREFNRRAFREAHGIPESSTVVTFVGRLDHSKDPILLLQAIDQACRSMPDLRLVIVGDGSLRSAVEKEIRSLGLSSRVLLLGVCAPDEIANIHRAADAFVLSSAYEGMPIALLEAAAAGLPIASTPVGEVPRLVADGLPGIVAADRSPERLAEAIALALGIRSPEQRLASNHFAAQYSPAAVLGPLFANHRRQATVGLGGAGG